MRNNHLALRNNDAVLLNDGTVDYRSSRMVNRSMTAMVIDPIDVRRRVGNYVDVRGCVRYSINVVAMLNVVNVRCRMRYVVIVCGRVRHEVRMLRTCRSNHATEQDHGGKKCGLHRIIL